MDFTPSSPCTPAIPVLSVRRARVGGKGNLSVQFNTGHRIRVTVASTGAAFYEPQPQTGEPLAIEFPANAVTATNTVFHQRSHASRVMAPVVK